MTETAIFGPMFTMFLLTAVVWAYMYAKRIAFIRSRKLRPSEMTPAELARLSPPEVANPSDNLKNLFEIPVLFYALALYLYATSAVDTFYVIAGWIFVIFRIMHSAVHSTVNIIMLRFWLYAVSTLTLWVMVFRAMYRYIQG